MSKSLLKPRLMVQQDAFIRGLGVFLVVLSFSTYADCAEYFQRQCLILKCNLESKSGGQVSGYLQIFPFFACNQFFWRDNGSNGQADEFLLKFIKSNPHGKLLFFKHLHLLAPAPNSADKPAKTYTRNEELRLFSNSNYPVAAFLDSEAIEVSWQEISKSHLLECKDTKQIPAPVLNEVELALLSKPPKASFSQQHYPEGMIVVVSYNARYDTAEKLKSLCEDFVRTTDKEYSRIANPPYRWTSIFKKHADLFKKQYSPQGIVMWMIDEPELFKPEPVLE